MASPDTTLPGLPPPAVPGDWRRMFGWSVSRHHQWARCKRAFFFDSVAPWLPEPPVPRERLEKLRKLSPFNVVKGQAVHEGIEAGIPFALRREDPLKPGLRAMDALLRDFVLHPMDTLCEAVNGQPFGPEQVEKARTDGRDMMERFWAQVWPKYQARRYLQHEQFQKFEVQGHMVRLRLDLLTEGPDGLLITDWKTGRMRHDLLDDLQLGTYVLWATRATREPVDRVKAELVFLGDATAKGTWRTDAQLTMVERRIAASCDAMLALEGMEDAPANPGMQCKDCKFLTVCEDGRAFVDGGP
ncbi:MAG: PD-(D/E)XK nuclease family protein [Halobacteriales archaeon]|nr:PD-(D/E)XK nuclease family protein [Halobacteriales archaeon]